MKRGLIIILFISLFPLAIAQPILIFQNEEIQKDETILATILMSEDSSEFYEEVESSSIKFFEGRKEVFFESEITYFEEIHYLYIYANREGNFSIKISDILFKENTKLKSITLEKDFVIKTKQIVYQEEENETLVNKTRTQILQIKPGFIIPSKENLIKLTNKGGSTINITIKEEEISLAPNELYEIIPILEEQISFLNISIESKEFQIPILSKSTNDSTSINSSNEILDLRPNQNFLTVNIISGTSKEEVIQLFNFGEENITNIKISSDLSSLKISDLEYINAKEESNITLTFKTKTIGYLNENLTIEYSQYGQVKTLTIPLSIYILQKGSTEEDFIEVDETCTGLGGNVCSAQESCNGEPKFTKGGDFCCIGICEAIKEDKKGNYNWATGLLIFLVLGFISYAIYKKIKKPKPKSPTEKLLDSSKNYNKRITGGLQRS